MESGMATSTPTGGDSEFTENLLSVLERETEFERHRQKIPKYEIQRFMEDRFKCILRYNKSVDKWLRYAAIDTFRVFWARVVFNDDNLIFTGGRQGRQANEIISLNLRSKRWKQLPAMTYIRDDHIVVPLDGKMYAIGGENGRSLLASVEVFTSTGGWRTVRDMNTRRSAAAAVAFNGNIFVMGGDGGCEPLSSVERYDPNTDIWTFCASTNNSFSYHGAAVHKGFIYIVGKGAAERYDPRRDEWTNICACPSAIASPGCVSLNNQLWTIGGWWCGPKDCSYVYDEESDRWVEKSRLPKSAIYYCFTTSEALL
ncbi:unnamed protein product [Ceratitis capitata]|uniref:(Mediterranean fruit fly) hypothetical protein n=1 Tax=Ceratitis capitata TaxID=7213 RepID=A0A811UHN7_CERCA|nr:unnamed protein product [Ceratitis capitata]